MVKMCILPDLMEFLSVIPSFFLYANIQTGDKSNVLSPKFVPPPVLSVLLNWSAILFSKLEIQASFSFLSFSPSHFYPGQPAVKSVLSPFALPPPWSGVFHCRAALQEQPLHQSSCFRFVFLQSFLHKAANMVFLLFVDIQMSKCVQNFYKNLFHPNWWHIGMWGSKISSMPENVLQFLLYIWNQGGN